MLKRVECRGAILHIGMERRSFFGMGYIPADIEITRPGMLRYLNSIKKIFLSAI